MKTSSKRRLEPSRASFWRFRFEFFAVQPRAVFGTHVDDHQFVSLAHERDMLSTYSLVGVGDFVSPEDLRLSIGEDQKRQPSQVGT